MPRGSSFTAEQDAFIHANYKQGMSAKLIGERMSRSRSAVIGRAGRLGLNDAKDSPLNKGGPKPPKSKYVSAKSTAMEKDADRRHRGDPLAPVKKIGRTTGGWRPKECQFIAGDARIDPTMCGEPVLLGSSYCASHHTRCWQPVKARAA